MEDCLLSGTTARIIEERIKEEVVKHRLRQVFASDGLDMDFPEDDAFRREWKEAEQQLKEGE